MHLVRTSAQLWVYTVAWPVFNIMLNFELLVVLSAHLCYECKYSDYMIMGMLACPIRVYFIWRTKHPPTKNTDSSIYTRPLKLMIILVHCIFSFHPNYCTKILIVLCLVHNKWETSIAPLMFVSIFSSGRPTMLLWWLHS